MANGILTQSHQAIKKVCCSQFHHKPNTSCTKESITRASGKLKMAHFQNIKAKVKDKLISSKDVKGICGQLGLSFS